MPAAAVTPADEPDLARVLVVVRELAHELGGERAAAAVQPAASLERHVGFGSLERVELLSRLEAAFGRRLDDALLRLDTPAALADALSAGSGAGADPMSVERAARHGPATPPPAAATLHEALWRRAEREASRPAVYLREDDGHTETWSYGRLLSESVAVAGGLREAGIRPGERVALMLPTGGDFLRSFLGILLARAVPVPIYPPVRLDRLEEYALRQSGILADAGARLLITIRRALPVAEVLRPRLPQLERIVTGEELAGAGAALAAPEGTAHDPAFIQYTSGSTGQPKGVLLTHANLIANIRAIAAGVGLRPDDVGASWLPLYHDMGLIGSWLFCLFQGIPLALLSPIAFLARPERWLWAIHERRATLSGAPNFAYELCVRRVPDAALEGLDLSSWRCALNGAEPVSPETLERFAERFAACGFRREALMPVYGLAECSVALSFPPVGRGPQIDRVARRPFESEGRATPADEADRAPLRFVSAGRALPEHELRILDDAGRSLPERVVGRLVFRGPSMTPGYFNQPEATRAITTADGFLDSGDLAYVADGELYVTGRRKDLIIKAGRNLVPQEIEEVASEVGGIRKGNVVAFGAPDPQQGTERLVVVAETRIEEPVERERLRGAVTERVAEAVGVPPDVVALVPPGSVPKTSSGKVRRAETRARFLEGRLGRPPRPPLAGRLRLVAAAVRAESGSYRRAALRLAYGAYLGAALALLAGLAWPLAWLLRDERAAFGLQRVGARLALRLAGCRLSASGLELLRSGGPFVLACNHASYTDVLPLLALVPRPFRFVAKREVLQWPLIGLLMRRARHIPVDRWDASQGVADAAQVAAAIAAGRDVLVFPEATFTATPGIRPFRLGAFKAAVETATPVVPLALRGTRRLLGDGAWLPRPGPLHLEVGAPLPPAGQDFRAILELRDRCAAAIATGSGEPRLDLVAGGPPRR